MIDVLVLPKSKGLQEYTKQELQALKTGENTRTIHVKGEDVPLWVHELGLKGLRVVGLTGGTLYKEHCLKYPDKKASQVKTITWNDSSALYKKPTLCLLGPAGKELRDLSKNLTVYCNSKYEHIINKYLDRVEREKELKLTRVFLNGGTEQSHSLGLADLVMEIVYTGKSLREHGLKVYDKVTQNDFLILASKKASL